MMFAITDQDGNETTEELTADELRQCLTPAQIATLMADGRVAYPFNGGTATFALAV